MTDRQLTTQGAERKQQLLDAAARLFAEQGYAATRVVDIVDAAGVAKGLFYWYFENKEALFRELATEIRRRLRRQQAAAMDRRRAGARARCCRERWPACSSWPRTRRSSRCSRSRAAACPTSCAGAPSSTCPTSTALIVEGQADGTVTDDDPPTCSPSGSSAPSASSATSTARGASTCSLDELSSYVARLVARILTVDEQIARRSLQALRRARVAAVAGSGEPAGNGEPAPDPV